MSALEILNCEFDCGGRPLGEYIAELERDPEKKALLDDARQKLWREVEEVVGSEKPERCVTSGRATSTFDSCPQSPFPSPCEDTEVVGWASDDFGLLRALPLAIPASLILWAVIAAAWIALL